MLEICKASAGSGKTYKLTGDYIVKLFQNGEKDGYKHILAVTFTNKATDEMKSRILKELYIMSSDPSKSDYKKDFIPLTLESVQEILGEGGSILTSSNKDNLFKYPRRNKNPPDSIVRWICSV